MSVKVVLVDVNPKVVEAWRGVFAGEANVQPVQGSILAQKVDAWVSPTNAKGEMSGGVDAAIHRHFGAAIQDKVRRAIAAEHGGSMPVGYATCVPTGRQKPSWLISTPTMASAAEVIRDTLNVALSCCAAFQAVVAHNSKHADGIGSLALPGLGAGTGRVSPEACAELMWAAYGLFCRHYFEDFESMRATLEAEVKGLDPAASSQEAARRLREAMFERAGVGATKTP
jgi:O-acetyl-ADP-ribose deacetylase (regulator of RNase III)